MRSEQEQIELERKHIRLPKEFQSSKCQARMDGDKMIEKFIKDVKEVAKESDTGNLTDQQVQEKIHILKNSLVAEDNAYIKYLLEECLEDEAMDCS